EMLRTNIFELQSEGKLLSSSQLRGPNSFAWPLQPAAGFSDPDYYIITNYVDQDPGAGIQDYNCGTKTYDGHRGIDIMTFPYRWHKMDQDEVEVIALMDGTIIGKMDGNPDNSCDLSCLTNWNAVFIQHSDGSIGWYGHLKTNSLTTKAVGASVSQGEFLGVVGSSGCSTDPHLHLEVYEDNSLTTLIEPFAGSCNTFANGNTSWWIDQPDYVDEQLLAAYVHNVEPATNWGCPSHQDVRNVTNNIQAGNTYYFSTFYRDRRQNSTATITIRRPDFSVWDTWQHTSNNDYQYSSWWYWPRTIPANELNGTWTYEVTLNGETYSSDFDLSGGTMNCTHPDYNALMALYNSTNGANWNNNDGWAEGVAGTDCDVCNWYGIECDGNGRVTTLRMNFSFGDEGYTICLGGDGNNLSGPIPDLQLPFLEVIDLPCNNLSGDLPDFTGLPNLRELILVGNNLSGNLVDFHNIPNLELLSLSINPITGSLLDFTNLPNLEQLYLRSCSLSGFIPDFQNLPVLGILYVDGNNLIGEIPDFTNLPNMRILYFGGNINTSCSGECNFLTGSILDFSNMPLLRELHLGFNQFSGNIPNFINLPLLENFNCSGNNLVGTIPDFSDIPELVTLSCGENSLSGNIPDFTNLPNLETIRAGDNNLSGSIPDLTDNTSLREFRVFDNELEGCIPDNYLGYFIIPSFVNFIGNPHLPYLGDFQAFEDNGGAQIGAPCDDGNAVTINDEILDDCSCAE
ncbi:MAG: peptidoglycan DD-metalloendopeptidase family protein, partial [Bacteroidota bacterium]